MVKHSKNSGGARMISNKFSLPRPGGAGPQLLRSFGRS